MRVEMAVNFGPRRHGPLAAEQKPSERRIPRTRDRQLRWLALALHIEDLVQSGKVKSYSGIARMCGGSKARVSRILSLSLS